MSKKLLLISVVFGLMVAGSVLAAPTSTYVQNLYITAMKDASNPCLKINSAGFVSTSTCASGVTFTTSTLAGITNTVWNLLSSGILTISTSSNDITFTVPAVTVVPFASTTGVQADLAGAYVSSFNGIVGAATATGTANQISADVSASSTVFRLQMAGVTCGGTDKVSSISATGTAICTSDVGTNYWTLSGVNLYPTSTTYKIGIATTTPTYPLTIVGNAGLTGYLNFVNIGAVTTTPPAGSFNIHADTLNGFTRPEVDDEGPTDLVLSRDSVFVAKNTSGATIATGTPVYITGSTGNVPNVSSSVANSVATIPAVGLMLNSTANNNFGQVMGVGIISNINTSAFSTGDQLYVSTTNSGINLTNVRPAYPNLVQRVGSVLVSGVGNGSILVTIAPAVLGKETGTINSTFNIGGFLGITSSTLSSFFFPGTAIGLSTSNGSTTISNNGVTTLTAGTGIGLTAASGTPTISNNGVVTFNGVSGTVTMAFPLPQGSSTHPVATTSANTVSFVGTDATYYLNPIQCNNFNVQNTASSTTQYDDYLMTFPTTSTLVKLFTVQKTVGDTYTFNIVWALNRQQSSSTSWHATSTRFVATATTTPETFTNFASTTINKNMVMRLITQSYSSSTEFGLTYCYSENQ